MSRQSDNSAQLFLERIQKSIPQPAESYSPIPGPSIQNEPGPSQSIIYWSTQMEEMMTSTPVIMKPPKRSLLSLPKPTEPMETVKKTKLDVMSIPSTDRNGTDVNRDKLIKPKDENRPAKQPFKQEIYKSMWMLTGNVQRILNLIKSNPTINCLLEIFAKVIGVRKGKYDSEVIILLRDKEGPALQTVFYAIDFELLEIRNGDYVRCIGRFIVKRRVQLLKIQIVDENQTMVAQRLENITNFMLTSKQNE